MFVLNCNALFNLLKKKIMKSLLLFIAIFITTSTFSQSTPCPVVNGYGFSTVSSASGNCTSKVFAYINNNYSSTKSVRIQVYNGLGVTGPLLIDNCLAVPANTMSAYVETGLFTAPCMAIITYVISGFNSSNGNCSPGAACGTSVTVISISANAGPLPIKMSSFYATRKNNTVRLNWQSESEINGKEFIVQRKAEKDYTDIATIPATDNANGSSYSYTDYNNFKALSQYRLKMVDEDGKFAYSEVRTVKGIESVNDFNVFPNPSTGSAKVTVSDISEPSDIQLIDLSGRVIKTVSMNNTQSINITNMQNGVYMLRLTKRNSGESLVKKITVVD